MNEQLRKESSEHVSQQSNWEQQFFDLDKQVTELKMVVVEFELEKASKQQNFEQELKELQEKISKQQKLYDEEHAIWMNQVCQLKAEVEEVRYYAICCQ